MPKRKFRWTEYLLVGLLFLGVLLVGWFTNAGNMRDELRQTIQEERKLIERMLKDHQERSQ